MDVKCDFKLNKDNVTYRIGILVKMKQTFIFFNQAFYCLIFGSSRQYSMINDHV